MKIQHLGAWLAVSTMFIAVSACTTGGGTPVDEPGSPSEPPPPTLELSGAEVRFLDGDADPLEIGLDAPPEEMIAFLTDALGAEPVVDAANDHACGPSTSAQWVDGGGALVYDVPEPGPSFPYGHPTLRVTVAAFGGIEIVTDTGFGVGDDVSDAAAEAPEDQSYGDGGADSAFVWAAGNAPADHDEEFGGIVFHDDGQAEVLITPATFGHGFC